MEHIHLLVSTFDTSIVAVAHNLRSCSRPPSETKTKTRQAETKTSRVKTKTSKNKKVVLIGLETKTRSRDPHPWKSLAESMGRASGSLLGRQCPPVMALAFDIGGAQPLRLPSYPLSSSPSYQMFSFLSPSLPIPFFHLLPLTLLPLAIPSKSS